MHITSCGAASPACCSQPRCQASAARCQDSAIFRHPTCSSEPRSSRCNMNGNCISISAFRTMSTLHSLQLCLRPGAVIRGSDLKCRSVPGMPALDACLMWIRTCPAAKEGLGRGAGGGARGPRRASHRRLLRHLVSMQLVSSGYNAGEITREAQSERAHRHFVSGLSLP